MDQGLDPKDFLKRLEEKKLEIVEETKTDADMKSLQKKLQQLGLETVQSSRKKVKIRDFESGSGGMRKQLLGKRLPGAMQEERMEDMVEGGGNAPAERERVYIENDDGTPAVETEEEDDDDVDGGSDDLT